MAIYVVSEEIGVETYKNWWQVRQRTDFQKEEFAKFGSDYVLYTDRLSYQISRDIKSLERVASAKVFNKDGFTLERVLLITAVLFMFLTYFTTSNIGTKIDTYEKVQQQSTQLQQGSDQ